MWQKIKKAFLNWFFINIDDIPNKTFHQRLPNYFDHSIERVKIKFCNMEDLLANEIFDCWKKQTNRDYEFVVDKAGDIEGKEYFLMVLHKKGAVWYVIGWVPEGEYLNGFPRWNKEKSYKAKAKLDKEKKDDK